jgi:hypothetical protein
LARAAQQVEAIITLQDIHALSRDCSSSLASSDVAALAREVLLDKGAQHGDRITTFSKNIFALFDSR